jgi:hypothetical protein
MPLLLLLSQTTFVFNAMLLLLFDFSLAMVDTTTLHFKGSIGHFTIVVVPLHPIPIQIH